jgi:hypothetical protein
MATPSFDWLSELRATMNIWAGDYNSIGVFLEPPGIFCFEVIFEERHGWVCQVRLVEGRQHFFTPEGRELRL